MAPNKLLAPSTSSYFIGRLKFNKATTLSSISFGVRETYFRVSVRAESAKPIQIFHLVGNAATTRAMPGCAARHPYPLPSAWPVS